mgnify:FL=1
MTQYFPRCPICKSNVGYEARGLLSTSQYIRCKTCGAQWTSSDFVGYKDLKTLKLWEPPEDANMYAKFMSQSALKPRKTYPVKLWQALMKDEEIQIPTKERSAQIKDYILHHGKGAGCLTISFVVSTLLALIGHFYFLLSIADSYILFVTSLLGVFFGLVVLWR